MRIYSMTATFGKLENATLTLQPGLNILHAPNEWGKSTWCAFLAAMLYGIDTRVHSTRSALADKDRYTPWSGSPRSGRIDLCWNGKDITIERSTKGRTPLGQFRAYETHSGIEVSALTAENCGEQLLGVERSVFMRGGFLLRRKTLANSLSAALKGYDKETIQTAIEACGLRPDVRGERLTLQDFANLAKTLAASKA